MTEENIDKIAMFLKERGVTCSKLKSRVRDNEKDILVAQKMGLNSVIKLEQQSLDIHRNIHKKFCSLRK